MKHLLFTTIAAVVLVGCVTKQLQKTKAIPIQQPEPPTTEAPDISIHESVKTGNIEAVKQDIAAGTDVDAKTKFGDTPLICAASEDSVEIVELLIAEDADVNAKDAEGLTPLHKRIAKKEIAEMLIANGADVNAKCNHGATPLVYMIAFAYKEGVEWLIDKGADVNAKYDGGKTPLDTALLWNHPETAALLRKHGGKTGEELKAEGK